MTMLTISNFQKKYPGTEAPVLTIPQLELATGIYWIKGENGSGKTSLIKSIAGLMPFAGNIVVSGFSLHTNRMDYTKAVNYAEAEPQYPPFLTGQELVDFYHSAKGGHLPAALIKNLGIDAFIRSKTAVYSSGMMKKLSLVLAFTGAPQLILLDEPLIALDTEAVEILQQAISAYHQKGISFIITSHQPVNNSIVNISDSYLIQDKKLVQQPK